MSLVGGDIPGELSCVFKSLSDVMLWANLYMWNVLDKLGLKDVIFGRM